MIVLTRTDRDRNMHRFYALDIAPTLIIEWGRIGSPGRAQHHTFADEALAGAARTERLSIKGRRGYQSTP